MSIRVVLVDDQELVRAGFRMVLETQADIDVVGEAHDGAAALRLLGTVAADVVVMDVRMPVLDGVEATRRLRESSDGDSAPAMRVLVLTTFEDEEAAFAALRAGASGFLLKNVRPAELLTAIRLVASGDAIVAPSITRRLLDRFAAQLVPARPGDTRLGELTDREREVTILIAQGLSNAEISARLDVAEGTVKSHVRRILTKLNLRDRVQVVVFAYETGLVRPGS